MIDSANPTYDWSASEFKPGCLPRKSKPGEWFPMAADRIKLIPRADWAAAAAELGDSLKLKVPVVLNQGRVGSCSCESGTGALMLARACQGLPFVLLNPYFAYRVVSGGRDQGSAIDDVLAFIMENGVAPEALHPRSLGWRAKPSDEAIEAAKEFRGEEFLDVTTIDEMVSCLLTGWGVAYGANGHSVLKVQHLDERKGLDLNSWGVSDGDGGFRVWATYNAVDFRYGAYAFRLAKQ